MPWLFWLPERWQAQLHTSHWSGSCINAAETIRTGGPHYAGAVFALGVCQWS